MLFELGSKDTALRGDVVLCGITNNKPTDLEISEHPAPVAAAQSPEDTLESEANDPTYEKTACHRPARSAPDENSAVFGDEHRRLNIS